MWSSRDIQAGGFLGRPRRRCGLRLGRLVPGGQEDPGDDHDQAGQPAEDEGQALDDAALRAEQQDESGDGEWFQGDAQADEQQIEPHAYTACPRLSFLGRRCRSAAVVRLIRNG
jgi:hypothetical protein